MMAVLKALVMAGALAVIAGCGLIRIAIALARGERHA